MDGLTDESFYVVYTRETFVHATEPELSLAESFRVTKPGGSIGLYEYNDPNVDRKEFPADHDKHMEQNTTRAVMLSNAIFTDGTLQRSLEDPGFHIVVAKDLSQNLKPMVSLLCLAAFIPYTILSFLEF